MAEREIVIDKQRITYEGLFTIIDIYNLINEWLEEKGYDKREINNFEKVTPEGKYVEILLQPWKKITDYSKIELRMRLIFIDVKDVDIERDGVRVRMNQGRIQMVFDALLTTDYENRWEGRPIYYLTRELFNKYFYKPFHQWDLGIVRRDYAQLITLLKSYLNLYRYKA
jgi:hypothetical protein